MSYFFTIITPKLHHTPCYNFGRSPNKYKELQMTPTLPQKMRAKHIANENCIGLSTVWNYVAQGKLTPIKITKGITVFNRAEVEAFFNGNLKTTE